MAAQRSLSVGDKAPAFALASPDGTVRLTDFLGTQIVLYFYPRDHTPGCTREACAFQEAQRRLTRSGAVVLGVSCDSVSSHERFAQKLGLSFPLLSDPDASVAKAYGVQKRKSLYGRSFWGIERTTFIIDERGRVAEIFPRVQVDGHAEAVLEALRSSAR